jgi:hypothetical protein
MVGLGPKPYWVLCLSQVLMEAHLCKSLVQPTRTGVRLKIRNLKGKDLMALRDLGQILFSNPSFG